MLSATSLASVASREVDEEIRPVAIPRYNNENRWYIEKYQNILGSLE